MKVNGPKRVGRPRSIIQLIRLDQGDPCRVVGAADNRGVHQLADRTQSGEIFCNEIVIVDAEAELDFEEGDEANEGQRVDMSILITLTLCQQRLRARFHGPSSLVLH